MTKPVSEVMNNYLFVFDGLTTFWRKQKFFGFYEIPYIVSKTVVLVMKDAVIRLQLSFQYHIVVLWRASSMLR